jgi:hypothetical protein
MFAAFREAGRVPGIGIFGNGKKTPLPLMRASWRRF